MIPAGLQRWKPGARARTQLLLAALLWSVVGIGLGSAGVKWVLGGTTHWAAALLALAVALGLLKCRFALQRTALRIGNRIAERGDGKCVGGFLSWKTWLGVIGMMALGAGLRRSELPRTLLGVVYAAIGVALVCGSRTLWKQWKEQG